MGGVLQPFLGRCREIGFADVTAIAFCLRSCGSFCGCSQPTDSVQVHRQKLHSELHQLGQQILHSNIFRTSSSGSVLCPDREVQVFCLETALIMWQLSMEVYNNAAQASSPQGSYCKLDGPSEALSPDQRPLGRAPSVNPFDSDQVPPWRAEFMESLAQDPEYSGLCGRIDAQFKEMGSLRAAQKLSQALAAQGTGRRSMVDILHDSTDQDITSMDTHQTLTSSGSELSVQVHTCHYCQNACDTCGHLLGVVLTSPGLCDVYVQGSMFLSVSPPCMGLGMPA